MKSTTQGLSAAELGNAAILALGEIGDPDTIPDLERYSSNTEQGMHAIKALGQIHHPDAVISLNRIIERTIKQEPTLSLEDVRKVQASLLNMSLTIPGYGIVGLHTWGKLNPVNQAAMTGVPA